MAFAKGQPKTGGRKRGTPNKATQDLKVFVSEALEASQVQVLKDLEVMEPVARVNAFLKLLEFVLPKQRHTSAEIGGIDGGAIQICSIRFVDDIDDAQALKGITTAPQALPIPATIVQEAPQEAVLIVAATDDNRKGSNQPPQEAEPERDIYY